MQPMSYIETTVEMVSASSAYIWFSSVDMTWGPEISTDLDVYCVEEIRCADNAPHNSLVIACPQSAKEVHETALHRLPNSRNALAEHRLIAHDNAVPWRPKNFFEKDNIAGYHPRLRLRTLV